MIDDKQVMNGYSWYTVSQFAELQKCTGQNIRNKLKYNRLQQLKYHDMIYVAELDTPLPPADILQQPAPQQLTPAAEKLLIENDLKREKLLNLKQDTILKKLKNEYTKQMYRQEYVEGVFDCFSTAFSKLKNNLIQLKLGKQQNEKLKKSIQSCIKEFEKNLQKYLTEKDRQETGENEENQAE